jgi:uncharacterized protein (UPF0332 family)
MAFPDDLLEQAKHLANREPQRPKQASLRRAVSTAYYALFHLLSTEAALNWKRPHQRHLVARLFDHGKMKAACDKRRAECARFIAQNPAPGPDLDQERSLQVVTDTFFQSQQKRHTADYDNGTQWTHTNVLTVIDAVEDAFQNWKTIRNSEKGQTFLISLLGPRQN